MLHPPARVLMYDRGNLVSLDPETGEMTVIKEQVTEVSDEYRRQYRRGKPVVSKGCGNCHGRK